jgi:hypothetical protein
MGRPKHPKPAIEQAVRHAEKLGWRVVLSNGHAWGRLSCPLATRDGCIISVWSTPRVAEHHARHIRKFVDSCPHQPQRPQTDVEEERDNEDA